MYVPAVLIMFQVGDTDSAQSGFWSVRESFVSFVVTNLPFIYPLVRGYIDKTRSSTNKSGNVTGEGLPGTGSKRYRVNSLPSKGGQRPVVERADSAEHIVSKERELPYQASGAKSRGDDESSLDSVTLENYRHGLSSPGLGVSHAVISARAGSTRALPHSDVGGAQGILVTRRYEVSED